MEDTRSEPVPSLEEPLDVPATRRRGWWIPGALMLVALLAFIFSRHAEEKQFLDLLRQARPAWLLVAALCQLGTYLCVAGIWWMVLRRYRLRASLWSLSRLSLMKLAFDQVIPTGGVGGSLLVGRGLRRHGATPGTAAGAVLLTVLCFYVAQALGVGVSLFFLWRRAELNPWIQWLVTGFGVLAVAIPVCILWATRHREWKPGRFAKRIPALGTMLKAIAEVPPGMLLDPGLLARGVVLQLGVYVLDAATLGAMLRALGQEASSSTVFVSFMVASMAETVSIIPGGVGTYEAASVGMLNLFGIPVEAALAGTLLLRGFTLWLPLLPGLYLLRHTFSRGPTPGQQPG
ncbi:lysylphosphatidylglycerol synthase transmembrane domain-containing protein [Corallococcus sp. bb12-1]|uniref:lysylphosphatidylglycerol synthase transmembrane domain-containing protein n=1 Tax=Corallococcus sp. bb12-1 TaxID=2996784 RepID=UPI0022710C2E|nr:lysylphosphatidylglycerol synthase transmembrane domain-containing protein [Corallococcus sp. bb12-1]MCY1046221.1 lysylphosphatidylglycerol synthase transmembrane domain-containing protein [Corallococcus sp. bb12-1]